MILFFFLFLSASYLISCNTAQTCKQANKQKKTESEERGCVFASSNEQLRRRKKKKRETAAAATTIINRLYTAQQMQLQTIRNKSNVQCETAKKKKGRRIDADGIVRLVETLRKRKKNKCVQQHAGKADQIEKAKSIVHALRRSNKRLAAATRRRTW